MLKTIQCEKDTLLDYNCKVSTNSIRDITFLQYLNHINIPKIRLYPTDNTYEILCNNTITLNEYYNVAELDICDIKYIFHELLMVLDYIHKKDVVHGNLEPKNILMSDHILINNFENATLHSSVGCPYSMHYRAPECLDNQYSTKSDIWALGCIMWELIFKRILFSSLTYITDNPTNHYCCIASKLGHFRKDYLYDGPISDPFKINKYNSIKSMPLYKLIYSMLDINPKTRPSAEQLLSMSFFSPTTLSHPTLIKTNNTDYSVIDKYNINIHIKNIAKHILEHLGQSSPIFQWAALCIASSLTSNPLEFHNSPLSTTHYNYGLLQNRILTACNFNILQYII